MIDADWPPELDAVVAAPEHHVVLLENDRIRVLSTRIEPGETTAVHTHRWPAALYVLSASDFIRRDVAGNVLLDSRQIQNRSAPGESVWLEPLPPHSLENVGTQAIHNIQVELKS